VVELSGERYVAGRRKGPSGRSSGRRGIRTSTKSGTWRAMLSPLDCDGREVGCGASLLGPRGDGGVKKGKEDSWHLAISMDEDHFSVTIQQNKFKF
jgi:hypothetical protein